MLEKGLKIIYWNADGIRNKRLELLDLLHHLSIDIVAISETRLSSNVNFELPGYQCYRNDKNHLGKGQGVAILIKSYIDHCPIDQPKTVNLETVGIEVKLAHSSYRIFSIYQSPNLPLLPQDLDALFNSGKHIILMGDFNARHPTWYGDVSNDRGKVLFRHMLSNSFIIHAPKEPTLVHYRSDLNHTLPDLALSYNISNISELETIPALSSDHFPVYLVLQNQLPLHINLPPAFNYRKADWTGFKQNLNNEINLSSSTFTSYSEINNAVNELQHNILQAKELCVPLCVPSSINNVLPRNIRRLINAKNRYKRLQQCSAVPTIRKAIKTQINYLQVNIKTKIKDYNDRVWSDKLGKIEKSSKDLWQTVKNIKSSPSDRYVGPLCRNDGTFAISSFDKADELGSAFHNNMLLTFNNSTTDDIEDMVSETLSRLKQPVDDNEPLIKLVRPHELTLHIRKLKVRKAPGEDRIDNILLKNLPQKAVVQLTRIFNACLRLGYYPDIWKQAKVIALKKPGKDHSLPVNYRPISLLPSLGKLLEKVIYSRLVLNSETKIIAEQFGFRSNHSTTQQLARVAEIAANNLNLKKSTGMLLFDLEKAFDTVWHDGLLHKLANYTSMRLTRLIQSYLTNRSFKVHLNNQISPSRDVPAGVPQGSILGPALFLIFLNDIPTQPRTQLACFADDTASITVDSDVNIVIGRLELSAELITEYFSKWKLQLNCSKTEAIIFTRVRKLPTRRIKIGNVLIPWSTSVKYLGVHLDRKLNWITHVSKTFQKGLKTLNALQPILNRKSNLSPATKLAIYTTFVRPILTYACPVWSSTADYNYYKLQILQNKALKIAYNTPYYTNLAKLHSYIQLPLLKNFILKLARKFYNDNLNSSNSLISSIATSRRVDLPYIDTYSTYRLPHHYFLDHIQ